MKHIMVDTVTKKDVKPLTVRVLQGNFSNFLGFTVVKYFNLTLVNMTTNCSSLITVVLAALILGERIFLI